MTAPWTRVYDEISFIGALLRHVEAVRAAQKSAGTNRAKVEGASFRQAQFVEFARQALNIDDPTALPATVGKAGTPVPNLYRLKVGPWSAYYIADPRLRAVYCALVAHADEPIEDRLDELSARARGDHASDDRG